MRFTPAKKAIESQRCAVLMMMLHYCSSDCCCCMETAAAERALVDAVARCLSGHAVAKNDCNKSGSNNERDAIYLK